MDCTHFVLNARDFLHSLTLEQLNQFNSMLEAYNNCRGEYFVIDRKEAPWALDAQMFYSIMKNVSYEQT